MLQSQPRPSTDPAVSPVDFEAAYRRLARPVQRMVGRAVRAPQAVIEEACQTAWSRLLSADPPVAVEARLVWLTTTATREAARAARRQRWELPLHASDRRSAAVIQLSARPPGPEEVLELRDQLAEVRRLPVRQQRMVWLQGLGYGYAEIAEHTGDSRRTVERQLLRARRTLRQGVVR
jgi:RNA polymerase sigma factor (sigma-70 family)